MRAALTGLLLLAGAATAARAAEGPSFDCRKTVGSIQPMVCQDAALSALDRQLAKVYGQALAKAKQERPPRLVADQRGWVKGRDDCWKAEDKRACVEESYVRRIAELQVRYRLLPGRGPIRLTCDGDPRNEVMVTHFATTPATLEAERGDQVSLMFQQPSGSGILYVGRNERYEEHQGEMRVQWGYQAPVMRCKPAG